MMATSSDSDHCPAKDVVVDAIKLVVNTYEDSCSLSPVFEQTAEAN